MGNCRSCESRFSLTAKLVLLNGQLREFSYPVKVSDLMIQNSDTFICCSDDMEFGEALVAVDGSEELRAGELYFELPSGWRSHRLQSEDMAALAVKASEALAGGGGGDVVRCSCCLFKRVERTVVVLNEKERPLLAADGGGEMGGAGGGLIGRRKFVPKLSVVVEEL